MSKPAPQENSLVRMVFAGMASICAGSATHPIELVKTRVQIKSTRVYSSFLKNFGVVYEHEGLKGLYKGLTASCMREGSYSTLRLGLYEPFKALLGETDSKSTPIWKKFVAAAASGALGSLIANPTDLLKIRMMAWEHEPHPLRWHIKEIFNHSGLLGFYRGVSATVVRATLLNSTKLATYDHIKHTLLNLQLLEDGMFCHFVSSVLAGICMAVVTSPMDLIKTRIMNQKPEHKHYHGIVNCAVKIFKEEGITAFYKGFTPQWMRFGPFTVVQLVVWEWLRRLYGLKGI